MTGSNKTAGVFSVRDLCTAAILTALAVIIAWLCKFLTVTQTIRITFENLPIIMSGFVLGPVAGLLTGLAADFISAAIFYGIGEMNPFITVASGLIGLIAGVAAVLTRSKPLPMRLALAVFPAHIIGNMLIKTVGFRVWYGTPFFPTLAVRAPLYAGISAAEYVILLILLRSDGVRRALGRKNV